MSDRDLLEALDDLAAQVAEPDPTIDVTARAVAAITAPRTIAAARPRRRLLAVAAATIAVVAATVPSTRAAVADWLGLGGIRITTGGPSPTEVASGLDLGRPVSLAEAQRLAPGPWPAPSGIGSPAAAFVGRPPDGVTLVWAPTGELPEVLDHDLGLLVGAFPGSLEPGDALVEKRILAGGAIEPTSVGGEPAYWLSGAPHAFIYLDEHGTTRDDQVRLSGDALIWAHDGITYRLESDLPLAEAVRLAETLPR